MDAVLGDLGPATEVESERLVRGGRARQRERRHLLLPTLIALQEEVGWISPGATNHVGRQLAVPPAEVYGVATFYELLRTTEPDGDGPTTLGLCRRRLPHHRGRGAGGRRDGAATTSPCLGRCEQAPGRVRPAPGARGGRCRHLSRSPCPRPAIPSLRLLRRVGRVDPTSLDSYLAHGGGAGAGPAAGAGPGRRHRRPDRRRPVGSGRRRLPNRREVAGGAGRGGRAQARRRQRATSPSPAPSRTGPCSSRTRSPWSRPR